MNNKTWFSQLVQMLALDMKYPNLFAIVFILITCIYGDFHPLQEYSHFKKMADPIATLHGQNIAQCIQACIANDNCRSINYKPTSGGCQLLSEVLNENVDVFPAVIDDEWIHYATQENKRVFYSLPNIRKDNSYLQRYHRKICKGKLTCPFLDCKEICEPVTVNCMCVKRSYTDRNYSFYKVEISLWTSWSPCSATCGGGTQRRQRDCKDSGRVCSGSCSEKRECNTVECPELCDFKSGDGIGGTEKYIGVTSTVSECILECKQRINTTNPNINGVTIPSGVGAIKCYCEFGMTGWNLNFTWKSCKI